MHAEQRARFNADFSPEKYAALLRCVNETEKWPADFRISETPIFLTSDFTDEVTRAAHEIVGLVRRVVGGVGVGFDEVSHGKNALMDSTITPYTPAEIAGNATVRQPSAAASAAAASNPAHRS